MFSRILVISLLFSTFSFANIANIEQAFRGRIRLNDYPTIINSLVTQGYYYSAIPWIKEFLVKGSITRSFELAANRVISHTGVKQFESMPLKFLNRSNNPYFKYVIGKKHYLNGRNREAINILSKINSSHDIYPFATHLLGAALSATGAHKEAYANFDNCVDFSESGMKRTKGMERERLEVNRDSCVAGKARALYAQRDYEEAKSTFLDVQKSSKVWPEILKEEAWNAYYLKNYNRTLGKLVTYNAPLFDFIFNPEVEVLRSLTYFRMCLYDDASKTAEDFYKLYLRPARTLRSYILRKGKNYSHYYKLMSSFEDLKNRPDTLMNKLLYAISKEESFKQIRYHLFKINNEFRRVRAQRRTRAQRIILVNIAESLRYQKRLVGSQIRGRLVNYYADLYKAFQDMSYIKLEILSKRKERLYKFTENDSGKRGDVKYIDRNDKQYFWNFNGEFWADELGDYVFALPNQCG